MLSIAKYIFLGMLFLGAATACSPASLAASSPTDTPTAQTSSASLTPPQVTLTLTQSPSETPAATLTNIPPETAAATPTDQAACTNQADFIADVTIPDNTVLKKGEPFTKTWRIRNTGTCTWNQRFLLVYLKGDQMSAPGSTELDETLPGANIDISVKMAAPENDGNFQGVYQFQDEYGKRFAMKDGNLWVRIIVGSGTPAPVIPTVVAPGQTPVATPVSSPTNSPTMAGVSGMCKYTENPDFEAQLISLINTARAANGLPAYRINNKLSAAALSHSIDMGCNNSLAHTGSDRSSPATRVAAAGYNASSIQEAIYAQPAQYGGTPQSAVDWWLNDAIHRPILLNSTLTEIGAGYVDVPSSTLGGYFTIDFAKP
jgi:uncharacterized protein YkwD